MNKLIIGAVVAGCVVNPLVFGTTVASASIRPSAGLAATAVRNKTESRLPTPTGPHAIGVRDLDPVAGSRLRAWYPAAPATGTTADYLPPETREYLGILGPLDDLQPFASENARPERTADPRPVVILTTGWASVLALSTALAEDLSSHGYVVLGLDPNLGSEDPVAPPGDGDAAERISAIRSLLDRIESGTLSDLVGPLDTSFIAAGGHSFGGATAFETALIEGRLTAVFDLDGSLDRTAATTAPAIPALIVATSLLAHQAGQALGSNSTVRVIELIGAEHYDFTDAPIVATVMPQLPDSIDLGTIGIAGTTTTTTLVTRFLDAAQDGVVPSAAALAEGLDHARSG